MRILVKITKEVLKKAADCGITNKKKESTKHCAIAEAVRPIFPTVEVTYESTSIAHRDPNKPLLIVYVSGDRPTIHLPLPSEANAIMKAFDDIEARYEYKRTHTSLGVAQSSILVSLRTQAIVERTNLPESSFELEIPDELVDYIGISEIHETLKNCNSLVLIEQNEEG